MLITGQLSFDVWPPQEQYLVASVKNEDRPLSALIDTSGRFVVRYADESYIISYTSQPLDITDDGSFTFCCVADELTGKIHVEINDVEILSYDEAKGASVAVVTATGGRSFPTYFTKPEPGIIYNEVDKAFLLSMERILNVLVLGDTRDSWKLSADLFSLLLDVSPLIDAVSKRWEKHISYTVVSYEDFEKNSYIHSDRWDAFDWNIEKKITTNQVVLQLDKHQFLKGASTIIKQKVISVEDVILSYLAKYKFAGAPEILSSEQNIFLARFESAEWGNSNFHGKLLEICRVVAKAVNPIISDIMARNHRLSHPLDEQYPDIAARMKNLFEAFLPSDFYRRHYPGFNSPEYTLDGFLYETKKIIMSYATSHMKDGVLSDAHRIGIADRILSHGKLVSTMVARDGGWHVQRLMNYIDNFVANLKREDSLFYKNN